MPITLKPDAMKYRDPIDGTYKGVDVIAERTTEELIADIESKGVEQVTAVNAAGQAAQSLIPDPDTFANLRSDFAPEFVANQPYAAGDYVMHNFVLYKRKTDTEGDADWVVGNWTQCNTGGELTSVKQDFHENLLGYNSYNVLTDKLNRQSRTLNGVTYNWEGNICTVTGSAESISVDVLIYPGILLPEGVKAGDAVTVIFDTTDDKVKLRFMFSTESDLSDPTYIAVTSSHSRIVIPDDAVYFSVGLAVSEGVELGTDGVVVSEIAMLNSRGYTEIDAAEMGAIYAKAFVNNAVTGELNALNAVPEWSLNTYIHADTGFLAPTRISVSASKNLISIPQGMKIHIHGASRIATYDAKGTFIATLTASRDEIISSEDAAFVRIQYGSVSPSVLNFYVAYRYSSLDTAQAMQTKIDTGSKGVQQTGAVLTTVTGNPLVMMDCDHRQPYDVFSVSDITDGENVFVCRKNIFKLRHRSGTFVENGVGFQFNTILDTVRIFSSLGSTGSATSGFADFGDEFKTVNGSTFYHNFKFRFPVDTRVSVTDNPAQEVTFDCPVQMRVYDGTTVYNIGPGGTTFVAAAGREYIAYFVVKSEGWVGDITFSPQIEIGDHPTVYEHFAGVKTVLSTEGEENIFTCGGTSPGRYTTQSGAIVSLFDSATKEVYLNAHEQHGSSVLIRDTALDDETINGTTWYHIFKFSLGRIAASLDDLIANGGKYTILTSDLEAGQWSYSTKATNSARGRTKSLIPVNPGTKVTYSGGAYDVYLGVLQSTTSSSYMQTTGWIYGDGTFDVTTTGYLTFIIRNHADPSATIDVSSFDGVVSITPAPTPVYVRSFNNEYAGLLAGQISDGINMDTIDYTGEGVFFLAECGREYGFRIYVRPNASVNTVLRPTISTGIYAIRDFGTYGGSTVIYTNGEASFTVKPHRISTLWKSERNLKVINNINLLTGGRIATPFSKLISRGPMISFIDDDTTNLTYVQRYHDIFEAKGQLGGYAVETGNLDRGAVGDTNPLVEALLDYETEGFAMLYHCDEQHGDETRYWIKGHPDYNQELINENFMTGLRKIRNYGFSNYKYWVTPYGVNDKYIQDLAKNHGMHCLLNCPGGHTQEGFVTPYGNVSRWDIPRVIFGNYTNNDEMIHRIIQNCITAKGWLTIVSHVNSWGSNVDMMGTRLSNLIQYCIDEGIEIVPFPVAFEEYRASFLMNELF